MSTESNLLPHILLGQDKRVIESTKDHPGTPWRKRSRMQGDFGLEQVFEHPASRTWVKILKDAWGEEVIGVSRRMQDLPTSEQFLKNRLTQEKPGNLPTFSQELIGDIIPSIDNDLKNQAFAQKWVNAWAKGADGYNDDLGIEKGLRALSKTMPIALANQFKFGVQVQEIDEAMRGQNFYNAMQMSFMQKIGGNNLLRVEVTLVLQPTNYSNGDGYDFDDNDDDEEYGEACVFPTTLRHLLPTFSGKSPGNAEEHDCYALFEKALKAGFIWEPKLQESLDNHTKNHFNHLSTGGSHIASSLEKAKMRASLDSSLPSVPSHKKRL